MAEAYLGEIRMVAFNFAPSGWALCQGQTLPISAYTALFSLLGTQFGGNGTSNFQLPDLQGRVPLNQGNGIGLPAYVIGQKAGTNTVSLTISNLPSHTHVATVGGSVTAQGSSAEGNASAPAGNYLAGVSQGAPRGQGALYVSNPASGTLGNIAGVSASGLTVTNALTGNNIPINIEPPYLCVNFIISLQGIYPSRG